MEVSVMIKKNREENGFTQQELADKLGVTRQAVSGWERGKAYPDLDKLKEISVLFGVSMDTLLYDDLDSKQMKFKSYKFIIVLVAFVAVTSLSIALYSIIRPPYYQMISSFKGECDNYIDYSVYKDNNSSGLMYFIHHEENVSFPYGTYCVPLVEVVVINDETNEATLYSSTRMGVFTIFTGQPFVSIRDDEIEISTDYWIGIKDSFYVQEGQVEQFKVVLPYPIKTSY